MRDVVLFGAGMFASTVWYLLGQDSELRVVGFTTDRANLGQSTMHDLPVVPFDALERHFPSGQVELLMAVGAHRVNRLRAERFVQARVRGYSFASYVSSRASVWSDLNAGAGCLIFDGAKVNPFATVGENCVLGSGSLVSHHAVVGDHCYVAPHAVVAGRARIGPRCFLGAQSAVRDGVVVGEGCFLSAGAVLTTDAKENTVYSGVPARRRVVTADRLGSAGPGH